MAEGRERSREARALGLAFRAAGIMVRAEVKGWELDERVRRILQRQLREAADLLEKSDAN